MPQRADSLRSELQSLFDKAKLPSGPAVAARILALIDDPSSTAEQFRQVIETDAALAGRLLQMANSPQYQQSEPVTTTHRAVTLIGLRRLRLLVLGFELINHIGRLDESPFDVQSFWQESLLRASLSEEVATRVAPALANEAFLVGLLQDCGIPLLVQILGKDYAELFRTHRGSPARFHDHERRLFPYTHVNAIAVLASIWNLPACIREPLELQHEVTWPSPDRRAGELLAAVSYFVGSVGFFADDHNAPVDLGLCSYARQHLGLDDEQLEETLSASADRYHAIMALFEDVLTRDLDITGLLAEAKRKFASEVADMERDLQTIQNSLARLQTERSNLAEALAQYRERASLDPLTGILNRGALVEMTRKCVRLAKSQNLPLAMFFLDLDGFKQINDEYGHAAGDEVLQSVSSSIARTAEDAIVGRYGGEEFVAVVPGVTAQEAEELGQAFVRAVRKTGLLGANLPRSVTCSVGALWTASANLGSSDSLFATADRLMYEAKRAGKDCSRFAVFVRQGVQPADPDAASPETEAIEPSPAANRSSPLLLEQLRRVADALDREQDAFAVDQRKHQRQALLTLCTLTCFVDRSLRLHTENAYARNISPGGLAVVATRHLLRGDLVEISINNGRKQLFLAGCVAFCRRIEGTIYDIGIQLSQQAQKPIFSAEPLHAARNVDWIAQALDQRFGDWRRVIAGS